MTVLFMNHVGDLEGTIVPVEVAGHDKLSLHASVVDYQRKLVVGLCDFGFVGNDVTEYPFVCFVGKGHLVTREIYRSY